MTKTLILVACVMAFAVTACGTPTARALQIGPSPTPYWSFLWAMQTAWQTEAPTLPSDVAVSTYTAIPSTPPTVFPTDTSVPPPPFTLQPTASETAATTPTPAVTGLSATVNVGFLSCRYGPGVDYLYLYALRQGANIKLIGRTDADNWHWAWVEGRNPIAARSAPVPALRLRLQCPVAAQPEMETPPREIVKALSRLMLYRMQDRARQEIEKGNIDVATRHLKALAENLFSQGERSLAQTIMLEVDHLQNKNTLSAEGGKKIHYGTRALIVASSNKKEIVS